MSDQNNDLSKENVHGVKNTWQRFNNSSWDSTNSDPEVEKPEPVVEPAPAPAPEPAPAPAPEPPPEPAAGKHQKKAARKMAASLGMSREDCLKQIVDDSELFKKYSQ